MTATKYHIQQNFRLPTLLLFCGIVILVILLILSIAIMILVMLFPPVENFFMPISGTGSKLELIKFIGWGISGIIAILVAFGILLRAIALDEQNKLTEKGHIHERFKAATEHLGSNRISMRIAAFYEFYRLAKLDPEPGLKETIFDILCAHLRKTIKHKTYQPEERESGTENLKVIKPTEEVRNLLNILFKPDSKDIFIFDCRATISKEANLQGANLHEANLQETKLQEANLQKAYLQKANLKEASLQGADLQKADLKGANLQRAKIDEYTTMPDCWKDIVIKDKDGETGVLLVDDEGKIIECL